ncbi:MAG: heat-inducible transcriptional repressor HrcA [Nitrospinaceae bacterium]
MGRKPTENLELDGRSKAVLLEVVDHYIQKAEPVGSRSVSKTHVEKLSPATIRNVMSDLEDLGYLHQPHTSAGRVPTDKGYRYFVNQIIQPGNSISDIKLPPDNYDYGTNKNLEDVLENACGILSRNSNQTGLVMLPSFSNTMFKHIQFVKVGNHEALAVFYSEMGILQNKIIPIGKEMSQDQLTSISNYLNQEFSGKTIKVIRRELVHRIRNEKAHYNQLMKKAMEFSARVFEDEQENHDLLVEGALNLLEHPEFTADIQSMKALLKTLEEKTKLIGLLDRCLQHDGITVFIGEESSEEEMQGCSLVAENYGMNDEKMGTVAIFGPKRMDYKKMISIVDHTAKMISKLLSERKIDL